MRRDDLTLLRRMSGMMHRMRRSPAGDLIGVRPRPGRDAGAGSQDGGAAAGRGVGGHRVLVGLPGMERGPGAGGGRDQGRDPGVTPSWRHARSASPYAARNKTAISAPLSQASTTSARDHSRDQVPRKLPQNPKLRPRTRSLPPSGGWNRPRREVGWSWMAWEAHGPDGEIPGDSAQAGDLRRGVHQGGIRARPRTRSPTCCWRSPRWPGWAGWSLPLPDTLATSAPVKRPLISYDN